MALYRIKAILSGVGREGGREGGGKRTIERPQKGFGFLATFVRKRVSIIAIFGLKYSKKKSQNLVLDRAIVPFNCKKLFLAVYNSPKSLSPISDLQNGGCLWPWCNPYVIWQHASSTHAAPTKFHCHSWKDFWKTEVIHPVCTVKRPLKRLYE